MDLLNKNDEFREDMQHEKHIDEIEDIRWRFTWPWRGRTTYSHLCGWKIGYAIVYSIWTKRENIVKQVKKWISRYWIQGGGRTQKTRIMKDKTFVNSYLSLLRQWQRRTNQQSNNWNWKRNFDRRRERKLRRHLSRKSELQRIPKHCHMLLQYVIISLTFLASVTMYKLTIW